jgi:serine/threonine-protein kinase
MGAVYRARDVRLHRDVALKVLPGSLLQDPERRARFEREARVLASLNHPNIASIYGIEDSGGPGGGTPVLVLELVDGQSLADRIGAGRVPLDEVVAIGLQVAGGLEAAHDRGIIHRDLKPANVQLTREGTVKVLDFGLAKALETEATAGSADEAQSPTLTSASTQLGVIMGTAAYMAPEQARGRTVDRRADIWAFGALLFEMLSGVRAFPGETISDTIAAVLTATPDWSRLPSDTPSPIRELVMRCLERDPRQRLQSIGEARIVLSRPAEAAAAGGSAARGRSISTVGTVAIALTAAAVTGAVTWWFARGTTSGHTAVVRKLDFALDAVTSTVDRPPVLSPDGARIAYYAAGRLWIRSMDDFTAREVAGSREGVYPFWSPDGQELAFVQGARLFRVSANGGEPRLVGAVPGDMIGSGAGAWADDGSFLVVGSDTTGITAISGRDGSSREILPLDRKNETDFHDISLLPDRRGLLLTAHTTGGGVGIVALADGRRFDVLSIPGENLRSPVFHPAGYLLFARQTIQRGVWAVRFSPRSLQTEGDPFLVDSTGSYPSVSRDGTVALIRVSGQPSELVWIDRTGSTTLAGELSVHVEDYGIWRKMRLSPDGQKVAIALQDGMSVYDLKRGFMSPIIRGVQGVVWPTWLPDGSRVLFGGWVGTRAWSVQSVSPTEISTPRRVLPETDDSQWPCAITPDGRWLLYGQSFSRTADLWIAPLDGKGDAKPLLVTPSNEREGHFSPDGRWVAYLSDESGRHELYLRRFPIGEDRETLSSGGAGSVHWSGDGREIFYRAGNAVMAVGLTEKDGRLEPSAPQRLFVTADPALSQSFVVSGDGQRFLFARDTGSDRVSVILNWTASIAK